MKHIILIVCAFLASCNVANKDPYDYAVCWEISKDDSNPSYILGSIHSLDTTKITLPIATITELVDKCAVLSCEAEVDSAAHVRLLKMSFLKDTTSNITNTLSRDYYEKLIQIMDSSKTELKHLKPVLPYINPSLLAFMVTGEQQLGTSNLYERTNFSMDSYLRDYAYSKKYDVIGLESVEDYEPMFSASLEESIKILEESIDNYYSDSPDAPDDMIENYVNQNIRLLKHEIYADSTMIRRNKKMADGIDGIMQSKPVFVVIGAAHLPYEHGVLSLLKDRGYTIKPYPIVISKK